MRAQKLPARAGWHWLRTGFALMRRNPALLILVIAGYWLSLLTLNLVPVLGAIAASLAIPGLSVGVMAACRELDAGRPFPPSILFSGFRDNVRGLLILGALYLALTLGAMAASIPFDGGDLFGYLSTGKMAKDADADSLLAALVVVLLMVPLVMAYWFAPMLAAWHRLPPAKALFFSLVAAWINWRAFFVYALALALIAGVLPTLVLALVGAVAPGAVGFFSALITIPMFMVLMPVMFASFYVSYRDVFHVSEHA